MSNLEYTIKELPDLLPLGIRNNMMQNNMLLKDMGDSINTFKESVLLSNPYYNKFYKHMKVEKLLGFINTTASQTKSMSPAMDQFQETHIEFEDGYIDTKNISNFYYGPEYITSIDRFSANNMLNLYQEYFVPTGRFSDIAYLNTIGPVGKNKKIYSYLLWLYN